MKRAAINLLAAVVLSASIGFALGRTSEPQPASARPPASASVNVLYQPLRQIQRNTAKRGALAHELYEICVNTLPPGKLPSGSNC